MAVFDYVAIDASGKRLTGAITADSPRSARKELRLRQLSPLDVKEAKNQERKGFQFGTKTLSGADRVLVTRQMAMLIQSGATVEEAIGAIATEAESAGTRRTLMRIRSDVQEGFALNEALGRSQRAFPPYYRAVVSAGIASGELGRVLERLATHLEKSRKLQRKLLAALIYPIVLAVVAMIVVALLLIFVVPAVVEQFNVAGQTLPPLTQAVIGVSDFIVNWGWLVVPLLIIGGWSLRRAFRLPRIKRGLDGVLLRLPLFGKLLSTVGAAQFARTFATLSSSGATVPDALKASEGAVNNVVFKDAAQSVRRQVEEGVPLNRAMKETNTFPPMLVHMVASGERGSDLPAMMGRAADYMEDELDSNATVALGLVEPAMIILLAGIVALIVLAIMLPILQMNTMAIGG